MRPLLSLNRLLFVALAWAGFAALALSVKLDWFAVPIAPPQGALTAADIIDRTPTCTVWFQAIMAVGMVCVAATWIWKRQWTVLSTLLTSLLCLTPLMYPYFVMIRSPVIAADAAWLQSQHNNLTWLGGDIYANAEFAGRGWKSKSYVIDTSRQLAAVNLPSWSPWEIGLHRCEDLMLWLGYSNTFCQFTRRGWAMAIIGSALLFLASLQSNGQLVFFRAGAALILFSVTAMATGIIGWALPFMASREIELASNLCSRREFEPSKQHLQRAIDYLPILSQDTYYVAQRGVLEQRMGIDSEYAMLQRSQTLETAAKYDQAFAILRPLSVSADPAIKREALRGVLRFAIQDFNCARFEQSRERFLFVLRQQPCDVKLIYLIQLQGIRESSPQTVDEMRGWMYTVCEKLNFGTVKILRAVVQQNGVVAAGMQQDADAIWAAQGKAKRP
ncbi:hypothetical protein [Stieleria sp.]|uniref:hypothetical protein n=1 Tax=Stieleria sp. TaxID=2795976 RepID=UPI003563FA61